MEKLFKKLKDTGFFHIFGSGVFAKAIGFLSSIVLVRLISKSSYGIFTYSWNIYSIAILFSGLGLPSAILQLASENVENQQKNGSLYLWYASRYTDFYQRVLQL